MADHTPIPSDRALTLYSPTAIAVRGREEVAEEAVLINEVKRVGLERPKNWPAMMSWPPKIVRDAIRDGKLNESNIPQFQAYYDRYAEKTVERAAKLRQHLERDASRNEDFKRVALFKKKKRFNYDGEAPHEHIGFASLLDPHGDHLSAYEKTVISWGRTSMSTQDGGKVVISKDRLRVPRVTEQSMKAMVLEAASRGWDTIEAKGDPKFVKALVALGQQHGIRVEATVYRFPFLFIGKKVESNVAPARDREMVKELGALRQELGASLQAPAVKNPPKMVEPSQEPEIPMG